jgi:drug/metabolite transporter (DMT)-like permease
MPRGINSIQLLFIESTFALAILFVFSFFISESNSFIIPTKKQHNDGQPKFSGGISKIKRIVYTRKPVLQLAKGIANTAGTLFLFNSLKSLPLVVGSALSLSSIIFSVIGAAVFFAEKPKKEVWLATSLSLVGIMCLSHAFEFSWALLYPIAASLCFSVGTLVSKELALFDSLLTSLFWILFLQIIFTAPFIYFSSPFFSSIDTFMLFITSVCIYAAFICGLQAEGFSALAITAPFKTIRVLFAALFGFIFFEEQISSKVFIGILCIVASYIFAYKNTHKTKSYFVRKLLENKK